MLNENVIFPFVYQWPLWSYKKIESLHHIQNVCVHSNNSLILGLELPTTKTIRFPSREMWLGNSSVTVYAYAVAKCILTFCLFDSFFFHVLASSSKYTKVKTNVVGIEMKKKTADCNE